MKYTFFSILIKDCIALKEHCHIFKLIESL